MAADPASVLTSLPIPVQTALAYGGGLAAFLLPFVAYFRPKKKAAAVDGEDKTVAVAIAAPLGDANQLRQMVEGLSRLSGFAEHGLKTLDDLAAGQERVIAATGRVEDAANRAASAARDVDASLNRLPRG